MVHVLLARAGAGAVLLLRLSHVLPSPLAVQHKIVKKRLKPFLRNQSDLKLALGVRLDGCAGVALPRGAGRRVSRPRVLAPGDPSRRLRRYL